jgi:hypothetical protein
VRVLAQARRSVDLRGRHAIETRASSRGSLFSFLAGRTTIRRMHRPIRRREFVVSTIALAVACAGGVSTRLRTRKPPTGEGAPSFSVANLSDTAVNNLYKAPTGAVTKAKEQGVAPGSPQEQALWGADLLGGALEPGGSAKIDLEPGRWDFRALDRAGREQHVTGVKIGAGGVYLLELGEGGWRAPR